MPRTESTPAERRRNRIRPFFVAALLLLFCLLLFCLLLARPAFTHLRAAGLLLRIQNPQHPGMIGGFHTHPLEESLIEVPTPSMTIRARLYVPKGIANAPGLVIAHGVHHLGMEDPRLVAFARALSASGIRVLTPELPALADYHVESSSIALVGFSARSLATSLGQKVGVLGISFGGGLSLLAASDPQFQPYIRFVVSVGAHDDLERVSQFFITNTISRPDGTTLHMQAHEYGPLVLIYSHLEDFFPPEDLTAAHEALRLLLWENVNESRKIAATLSPPSRQTMELLYSQHLESLAGEMKQTVGRHHEEMASVSPHGHLRSLPVPVLLLHGAADNVIAPSEELWLEQDVPPAELKAGLISPAISHASVEGEPSLADNARLVHFMAQMLELVGDTEPLPSGPR